MRYWMDPYLMQMPEPVSGKTLAAELRVAVKRKNAVWVREIFDQAFWKKIDLVPDWHQLLCAVALNDQAMVRLLATHGARWSEREARGIRDIFPESWADYISVLRRCGIETADQAPGQARALDRASMAGYIVESDADIFPVEKISKETESFLAGALAKALLQGAIDESFSLLGECQPVGSTKIDPAIKALTGAGFSLRERSLAIETLGKVRAKYGHFSLAKMDAKLAEYPDMITELSFRSLLSSQQPERLLIIRPWSESATPEKRQSFKAAAEVLFKPQRPLDVAETDAFISLYKNTPEEKRKGMDTVCEDLFSLGFFRPVNWTPQRLDHLAVAAPSRLSTAFNKAAAESRFRPLNGKDLLKEDILVAFTKAHEKGLYKADRRQAVRLLREMAEKYSNGKIPQTAADSLRVMAEKGVDYDARDLLLSELCGKKEPGLGKILLELDLLGPSAFGLNFLRKKAGIPMGATTIDPKKHTGKYAEFFCQVFLEKNFPEEFRPLRGKIESYSARMLEKYPPKPEPPKKGWFRL